MGFSLNRGEVGVSGGGAVVVVGEAGDGEPDPFSFVSQSDVALNTLIESNVITPVGYNVQTTIEATNGEYRLDGGAWQTSGTIVPGQTVQVRHTSSASGNTATITTITIGGVVGTFSSVTAVTSDLATASDLSFAEDFNSNGIPLYTRLSDEYGLADAYPVSGAAVTFMGGELVGSVFSWGDGNDPFSSNQNVNVVDSVGSNAAGNDPDAAGVNSDLRYAWRARYWNQQSGDAFQQRTLIIRGFNLEDCYIRFYYKWGSGFDWPNIQQKFLKAHANVSTGSPQYWTQNLQIRNQLFQITGPSPNSIWDDTFHRSVDNGGAVVFADDINNEQGPGGTDANITFQDDTWYCIELRILASTPGGSDGRYQVWVDNILWFDWGGVDSRSAGQTLGTGHVELHHIWQDTSGNYPLDTYCYLKGLAIADKRIGLYDPVRGF